MPRPDFKTHLVIAALVSLTLLVGALTLRARHTAFPPYFRGFGEVTPRGEVAGWAVNAALPSERVQVQLYVDGRFVAHQQAALPRPDVLAAGRSADEHCGYRFPLPPLPPGPHEARVYALHTADGADYRTLQQLGYPLRFTSP